MSRYDYDDRDDPRPEDIEELSRDEDDEDDIKRCPACGQAVHWAAPKCPACGEWFIGHSPVAERSQTWLWPTIVALLIAIILVMWVGLGR